MGSLIPARLLPWGPAHPSPQPPSSLRRRREVEVPAAQLFRTSGPPGRARLSLLKSVTEMKRFDDHSGHLAPRFSVGQKVWLSAPNIPLQTTFSKLAPRFIGPFPITRILSPTAVSLLPYTASTRCSMSAGSSHTSCWGNRALTIIIHLLTRGTKYIEFIPHRGSNYVSVSNQSHKITII